MDFCVAETIQERSFGIVFIIAQSTISADGSRK